MDVALKYEDEIREHRPIAYQGLMFYPLAVKRFALYQGAKAAMELMLSSLPPKYARYSWAQALDMLDRDAIAQNQIQTGYLSCFLLLLATALRLDMTPDAPSIFVARDKDGIFGGVIVRQDGGSPTALQLRDMDTVRQILAAQNGYEIPDENWNPELVRAQQYLREQGGRSIGGTLEDAVYALAAATGNRAGDIWEWPIQEFLLTQSAVDRRLRFQIFAEAELSGRIKFKHGNPYPTWIYANRGELPRGFTSLKELDDGANGLLATPTEVQKE